MQRFASPLLAALLAVAVVAAGAFALNDQGERAKKVVKLRCPSGEVKGKITCKVKGKLPQGPEGPRGEAGPPGPATGPAGGDLTGSYPDPQIAPGAVGPAESAAVPAARLRLASATTIPSAAGPVANTPLNFGTEVFDVGAMHSAGQPSRLTAPIAGLYDVQATVEWDGPSTNRRIVSILRNGGSVEGEMIEGFDATGDRYQNVSGLVPMTAGEFVEIVVGQNTGGNLNVETNATSVSAVWVAPAP